MAELTGSNAADTPNMAELFARPSMEGRGKRARATTQAATAASAVRATTKRTSSQVNTRESDLRASDSTNSDSTKTAAPNELPSTADTEHKDAVALHFAGYRSPEYFSKLNRNHSKKTSICICEILVDEDMEVEDLIKCSMRDCETGWYHLECVGLPDHPPRLLGWMCPGCIRHQGISVNVKGMFDVKGGESTGRARAWLAEMAKDRKRKASEMEKAGEVRGGKGGDRERRKVVHHTSTFMGQEADFVGPDEFLEAVGVVLPKASG